MGEYDLAEKALAEGARARPGTLGGALQSRRNFFPAERTGRRRVASSRPWRTTKSEQAQGTTGDLIQFKILLTYLLEGKEKKAVEIVDRLQTSSTSPAYYCGKAAVALRRKEKPEAMSALKAAEKSFSPSLYKLFARITLRSRLNGEAGGRSCPVALEVASRADLVGAPRRILRKRNKLIDSGITRVRLQLLDQVDATESNQALSLNLRGKDSSGAGKRQRSGDGLAKCGRGRSAVFGSALQSGANSFPKARV